MNIEHRKCLICYRMEYDFIVNSLNKLINDVNKSYEIADCIVETIKNINDKKPYALCGRNPKALTGGFIYIALWLYGIPHVQIEIADIVGLKSGNSIRGAYAFILKEMNINHKDFHDKLIKIQYRNDVIIPNSDLRTNILNFFKLYDERFENNKKFREWFYNVLNNRIVK